MRPVVESEEELVYPLASVAELIWAQGGFCPEILLSSPERSGDEAVFSFSNESLSGVVVTFGYAFETIGQDPDTLSDLAMSALARSELQHIVLQFTARYGAPSLFNDTAMRSGKLNIHGCALFASEDGGAMHVMFGHDGAALAGVLRYRAPMGQRTGF
ncbi:MAG: hypothetical protein AAGD13_10735 [Pseudomonadota bacterium]